MKCGYCDRVLSLGSDSLYFCDQECQGKWNAETGLDRKSKTPILGDDPFWREYVKNVAQY